MLFVELVLGVYIYIYIYKYHHTVTINGLIEFFFLTKKFFLLELRIYRYFGDRYGRVNTITLFTLLSGIFTMVVWQFATTYGAFVAYCVLFGLTGGSFVSLMPPVVADIVGIENIQKGVSISYALTMFGNLLGTPISGKLREQFGWTAAIQFPGAMTGL